MPQIQYAFFALFWRSFHSKPKTLAKHGRDLTLLSRAHVLLAVLPRRTAHAPNILCVFRAILAQLPQQAQHTRKTWARLNKVKSRPRFASVLRLKCQPRLDVEGERDYLDGGRGLCGGWAVLGMRMYIWRMRDYVESGRDHVEGGLNYVEVEELRGRWGELSGGWEGLCEDCGSMST